MLRRLVIVATALAALWAGPAHASTFCGTPSTTDRTPNAAAGYPIHLVYAIPSDGVDRFAQVATQMQTDAETIDLWWRSQDPTRTVRFDTFAFPCGVQVDLTSLRLPQSSSQLANSDTSYFGIAAGVQGSIAVSPYVKYFIYYDAGLNDPDLCGQAGGDPLRGPSLGIVYLQGCAGVPTAPTVAHELIHELGAVPFGAPHRCPDSAHTCDNNRDLMYPYADGSALSALLLDPGRDDYYGHSGSWWDVQDSKWLVRLDAQVKLSLAISGAGTVGSDVPGVACAASCESTWDSGTPIVLTPTPAQGMRFVRWAGACAGAGTCSLKLAQASSVSALFAPARLTLSVAVSGKGTVRVVPRGAVCARRCAVSVPSYQPETLSAKAAKGWRFKGWAGACSGTRTTCTVPMSAAASARATFVKKT